MFLIFGLRTKAQRLGLVSMACRVCRQTDSLLLVREVTKLSLFFIPLVPVRTKYAVHCTNPVCGARIEVAAAEARELLAGVGSWR
ncbi:MAG TPA: zinc-ribbon domain-containing protein [Micromonosporaceae bacterium]|nr:zinc-ribbon domain-containing protein [Micromonosporaceae bacterium]